MTKTEMICWTIVMILLIWDLYIRSGIRAEVQYDREQRERQTELLRQLTKGVVCEPGACRREQARKAIGAPGDVTLPLPPKAVR